MSRQEQDQIYWAQQRDAARQLKTTLLLGVIAFGVTLAIVIGNKMDRPAATVMTGIIAGIAASIPTTFVLLNIFKSRTPSPPVHRAQQPAHIVRQPRPSYVYSPRTGAMPAVSPDQLVYSQPPMVVVAPPVNYDPRNYVQAGPVYPNQATVLTSAPREFQVIGEQDGYWDEVYE